MNPQKITEWLLSGEFVKGVVGAGVSGSVMLYVSIITIDHKIDLEKVKTDSRIAELENKVNSDVTAIYRYVDSANEVNKIRFQFISDSLSDIKTTVKKISEKNNK